jgi:hypothetical protein
MHRPFMARRNEHGREGEVLGRHDIGVRRYARAAGADIAHLGAAVFRIEIGLKLERVPVVAPGVEAGDPRVDLRLEAVGRGGFRGFGGFCAHGCVSSMLLSA